MASRLNTPIFFTGNVQPQWRYVSIPDAAGRPVNGSLYTTRQVNLQRYEVNSHYPGYESSIVAGGRCITGRRHRMAEPTPVESRQVE